MDNNHNKNKSEWDRISERLSQHYDATKKDFVIVNMPECKRETQDDGLIEFDLLNVRPGMHLRLAGDMCSICHSQWHYGVAAFHVESYELDDYLEGWDMHVIKSETTTYVCLESHRERFMTRESDMQKPQKEMVEQCYVQNNDYELER